MKYREILTRRNNTQKKIDDLKLARDLKNKGGESIILNDYIKQEKFKYQVYNHMLKKGTKNENEN